MRCRAIEGFGNGFRVWFVLVGVFGQGFWFLVGLARAFFGRFLPCLCGLRVGIFGSLIGDCPFRLIFLVFLGPWVASAAFWGLRGSGPRGWLFM